MKIEQIEAYSIYVTEAELAVLKKALNRFYEGDAYEALSSTQYETLESMVEKLWEQKWECYFYFVIIAKKIWRFIAMVIML